MSHQRNVIATAGLAAILVFGARLTLSAVNTSPTVSIVRSATLSNQVWPGDFNGDGITDLAGTAPVAPGAAAARVRVALGNGGGGFPTVIDTTFNGHVLGVSDMNGDGKLDLIALGDPGPAPPLVILPGNGNGSFAAPVEVNFFDNLPFAAGADIDGDGKRDLVLVNQDADRVLIFPGNGDFTFGAAVLLTTGFVPGGAIVGDFNGDGRRDIAVANDLGHSVSVFINNGSFLFTASDIALDRASDVTAGDVNGDGRLDLVVSTFEGHETVAGFESTAGFVNVITGRGDGTFNAPVSYPVAPGPFAIVVGDFTRDGVLDIATGNRSAKIVDDCTHSLKTWDSLSVLPGRGDGTFAVASHFSVGNQRDLDSLELRNSVTSLNTADLNGDRQTDLLISGGVLFLNQPTDPNWPPTVTASSTAPSAGDHSITLRAVADDVDQDMLTYSWIDSGGSSIPPVPLYCFTPGTLGVHTFTVTVTDTDGNSASSSVTVDFGGGGGTAGPTMTFVAPTAGETLVSGSAYTIRVHIDDPSMALYEWTVDYSVDNGATWNHIWECHQVGQSSQPGVPTSRDESCTWMNPGPPSTQAILTVFAQDDADAAIGTGSSVHVTIAPQPGGVPYPWQHQDIGAVAKAGTTTFSNGVFTVSGSGADIWSTADEFQYAYLADPTGGGLTILEAHVDSVQNVAPWTKAGLMFRAANTPGSPQASIFVTPGKGIAFQRRLTNGGTSVSTAGPLMTAPVWLRLTMFPISDGQGFRAYYRKNTTDPWTLVGQDSTTAFWWQVKAGLAVSSHADGTLATATFSSVRAFAGGDWHSNSIGASGGKAVADDTLFTVTGIGADIWGTSDQFEFVYQDCFGDCTITAHVRDVQNVHAWTKAGVMFRWTPFTGESAYVDAIVTPSKGVAMQFRSVAGGTSASAGTLPGVAPGWLRMTRRGNTFTSLWSSDGVHYTQIGSVTVQMNTGISVGLAVTSHNASTPATANFDSVTIQQP